MFYFRDIVHYLWATFAFWQQQAGSVPILPYFLFKAWLGMGSAGHVQKEMKSK